MQGHKFRRAESYLTAIELAVIFTTSLQFVEGQVANVYTPLFSIHGPMNEIVPHERFRRPWLG